MRRINWYKENTLVLKKSMQLHVANYIFFLTHERSRAPAERTRLPVPVFVYGHSRVPSQNPVPNPPYTSVLVYPPSVLGPQINLRVRAFSCTRRTHPPIRAFSYSRRASSAPNLSNTSVLVYPPSVLASNLVNPRTYITTLRYSNQTSSGRQNRCNDAACIVTATDRTLSVAKKGASSADKHFHKHRSIAGRSPTPDRSENYQVGVRRLGRRCLPILRQCSQIWPGFSRMRDATSAVKCLSVVKKYAIWYPFILTNYFQKNQLKN